MARWNNSGEIEINICHKCGRRLELGFGKQADACDYDVVYRCEECNKKLCESCANEHNCILEAKNVEQ